MLPAQVVLSTIIASPNVNLVLHDLHRGPISPLGVCAVRYVRVALLSLVLP